MQILKNRKILHHQTSVAHLNIQHHIKSLIPDVILEKSFPSLGRIADIAWEKHKIIFEIQCSPISSEEAAKRCSDYESLGYTPVWILHVRRFNKKTLSKAEHFLRKRACFFSDGFKIYDQFEILLGKQRIFKGPPLLVNLKNPLPLIPQLTNPPLAISTRQWPLSFQGDLLHRASEDNLFHLFELEKSFLKHLKPNIWRRLYRECLYFLLNKLTD